MQDKDAIIARTTEIFARRYSGSCTPQGGCLFWASAFCEAMSENGYKAKIVAGSASFQFRVHDDGVSPTHFSYMFNAQEAVPRFIQGLLPEMHVWAITEAIELVDLTTGYQCQQAIIIGNFKWDKELIPPVYLWCPVKNIPRQFVYSPSPVASAMAKIFLQTFYLNEKEKHETHI